MLQYNVNLTGQYVIRLALAEDGLNVTYFNGTSFGRLFNKDFTPSDYIDKVAGQADNFGRSISWTGDIGGPPSLAGDIGKSSYYDRYLSRTESVIDLNADTGIANYLDQTNDNQTASKLVYNFRENYWSARWKGMITAPTTEVYKFILEVDEQSSVNMWIGGLGVETNQSYRGDLVINSTAMNGQTLIGYYNFTDLHYREFLLEFIHHVDDARLKLSWESISTPLSVVPPSAFHHWRNMSHYNLTIHPTTLCPSCSTAFGKALNHARVGEDHSFLVYARDVFGNLVQRGGDKPTMVAVGKDGIAFRGRVIDYGNATYLISYYPTQAGKFQMYVSMGCCAPNPAVGYPAEILKLMPLLISGAPFELNVVPAYISPERCIGTGNGLVGADAGQKTGFTIYYRDLFNNPTALLYNKGDNITLSSAIVSGDNQTISTVLIPKVNIYFTNKLNGDLSIPTYFERNTEYSPFNISYSYIFEEAGSYLLHIGISLDNGTNFDPIISSPFHVTINPVYPEPRNTICRGNGLRYGSNSRSSHLEIQLYDVFGNKIITGGHKFYIRLIGDANYTRSLPVVPSYFDTQNGRYQVQYTAFYTGKHHLVIRMLQGNSSYPGGRGLLGSYFNGVSGASFATSSAITPILERVDPIVKFDWKDGYVLPLGHMTDGRVLSRSIETDSSAFALRNLGQAIRWAGYLVSPRDDSFLIFADSSHLAVSIYIDEFLVFDNVARLEKEIKLTVASAYKIRVEAFVLSEVTELDEVKIDLKWSSSSITARSISQFFLYDRAEEVKLSPFPVTVI